MTAATGEALVTEATAAPALDGAMEKDTKAKKARERNTRKIANAGVTQSRLASYGLL